MRLGLPLLADPVYFKKQPVSAANTDKYKALLADIISQFPPSGIKRFAKQHDLFGLFGNAGNALTQRIQLRIAEPFTLEGVLSGQYTPEIIARTIPDTSKDMIKARDAYNALRKNVKKEIPEYGGFTPAEWANLTAFIQNLRNLMAKRHDIDNLQLFDFGSRRMSRRLIRGMKDNEQVHAIADLDDLFRRVGFGSDVGKSRRMVIGCKDKYDDHGALMMINIAFVNHNYVSDNVQKIKDGADETKGLIDTAIFYTISNWERIEGLGRKFIYKLPEFIQTQVNRNVVNGYTLSPIHSPGPPRTQNFRMWILELNAKRWEEIGAASLLKLPFEEFILVANTVQPDTINNYPTFKEDLLKLSAIYLTSPFGQRPGLVDKVEKFHTGNGARLERINWMANPSSEGWDQSWGLMVNYRYTPPVESDMSIQEFLEFNQKLLKSGHVPCSPAIYELLGKPVPPDKIAGILPAPVAVPA